MKIKVFYIESKDSNLHEQDPLLLELRKSADVDLKVFAGSRRIIGRIAREVQAAHKAGTRCVIILNIFLRPEKEGINKWRRWDLPDSTLKKLFDCRDR